MPYIPQNQYDIKFTNGGELYNPSTGNLYTGYYIQYRNKYFAGNTPTNLKTKLRKIETPLDNKIYNTTTFLYNQLNKKFYQKTKNRKIPYPSKPLPTEKDYNKGIFTRYFCQRANNKLYIIELDKEVYNGLLSGTYNKVLYIPGKISWSLQNPQVNNDKVLKLEKKYPQLRLFFNNPGEFIKTNENLTAKLNELFYPDGTPYPEGLKYHIHPGKGPMEGAFHSNESHSLLTFNRPQPEITQDIPQTPTPPSYGGGSGY